MKELILSQARAAIVDDQVDRDLVGNRARQNSRGLHDACPEARRRGHRSRIEQEIDGDTARRYADGRTCKAGAGGRRGALVVQKIERQESKGIPGRACHPGREIRVDAGAKAIEITLVPKEIHCQPQKSKKPAEHELMLEGEV